MHASLPSTAQRWAQKTGTISRRMARLSNRLSGFAVYGIATGLAAVLTLVQTRVLWNTLSPADFGMWALVDPLLFPLASLVLFGIDHAMVKLLHIDRLKLPAVAGMLLVSTLPATILCLLAIGAIAQFVFHLAWTAALLLAVAGEALILMTLTGLRASGASTHFAAALVARNLLYLILLLIIRHLQPLTIELVFLSRGACVIVISLIALAALRPGPRFDRDVYRDALRYGFPLLLTTFIYALTDMTDRWFLAEFSGVVAVGVYALHLKTAAIMAQAIVVPFGLWFPAERFKRLDDPDQGRLFFRRTAAALSVICAYLSGVVWLGRDIVLPLIAPGVVASPLVLACCLGAVTCLALSHAMNVGMLMPGHTGKNVICTAIAVVAAVLAAAILVPLFGLDGAAFSRLFAGLVLVGATAFWSHRVFPVAFPYVGMLLYFTASVIAAAAIDHTANGRGLLSITIGLAAWTIITIPLGLLLWNAVRATADAAPVA